MPPDPHTEYQDDPTIPDAERLYRLIRVSSTKFENGVATRAQSNAFQDYPADRLEAAGAPAVAVSVLLESEMAARGTTVDDILARREAGYGLAVLTAGDARTVGQGVVRWPNGLDPEHGMIFCLSGPKKTNKQSKALARAATIVVAPSF